MLDKDLYKAIADDISLIEPQADMRIHNTHQRKLKRMRQYNKKYYAINQSKLRQQARARYKPVMQSPGEHTPIDYDTL